MKFVCFYHSLISDWNYGNAHFLRGYTSELIARGHDVRIYEATAAWNAANLVRDHGEEALAGYRKTYPMLSSEGYDDSLDLEVALDGADVVIVHEWTDPALVARIGAHRARARSYTLLFHDTHHRSVTAPEELRAYDLRDYDGVLAFGKVIRDLYLANGWTRHAWTWHEAADVRVFVPRPTTRLEGDVVWIGNWGDEERARELRSMLIEPIAALRFRARVYGVRYPEHARMALEAAGIEHAGSLPSYLVPDVLARFRATLHVPRRPHVDALRGVPTIRLFEALACGIPLISSPWFDDERLFRAGEDYLVARDGDHMRHLLQIVVQDRRFAVALAARGRETILARHTCAHRVDELLAILEALHRPRRDAPAGRAVTLAEPVQ